MSTAEERELWDSLARVTFEKAEQALDRGEGSCVLRNSSERESVAAAMHHFDEQRYELGSYVVMPNHVHLVIRPFHGFELEAILKSWKQ